MERLLDIIFSGLALLILSPLALPTVLILRFSGEGEVFFLQERIGKNGEIFKLFKFATMLKDSPNIGSGTVTMSADPRVLPIGKFLRKTKINELPQLLNILIGDMSIVGPRPLTAQAYDSYSDATKKTIQEVKPGLSGLGSIVFRGEEQIMQGSSASVEFYREVIAPFKGKIEEWFVANKNMYIYFAVIFITIWTVLNSKSSLIWRFFPELPEPPEVLRKPLNYIVSKPS
jgi:lipopolysaccharide/colanic/teichoic acid biosynthesis glycosyltransferase